MGRLLDDLQAKMQTKVNLRNRDPLKILVHSAHDTTLAGLCQTLDVFDNHWPTFTASITFELFSKPVKPAAPSSYLQSIFGAVPKREHYIRMRYQNRNLELPFCKGPGQHLPGSPEFCALTVFQQRVRELTPDDWEKECEPVAR